MCVNNIDTVYAYQLFWTLCMIMLFANSLFVQFNLDCWHDVAFFSWSSVLFYLDVAISCQTVPTVVHSWKQTPQDKICYASFCSIGFVSFFGIHIKMLRFVKFKCIFTTSVYILPQISNGSISMWEFKNWSHLSSTVKEFHCELGLKKLDLINWAFFNWSVTEGELLSKAVFSPFIVVSKIKIGNLFHTCKFSSLYLCH